MEQTLKTDNKEQLASHYALHVALQTMKERCISLQKRLTDVEDENLSLRKKYGEDNPNVHSNMGDRSEIETLREQVGELTRQKFQLTEHIGMVASENRQLWSRLSKLTKDNQTLGISLNKIKNTLTGGSMVHQNLIRSKTFTQNSPNPILRQRMMHTGDNGKGMDDVSLEEISLKESNDSSNEQCLQQSNNDLMNRGGTIANSMGFGYLNDESINTILLNDTKKCLDNMVDIKKELLRQQSDLKVALSGLRQRRVLEVCLKCKTDAARKANMSDKNMGTSDDLNEFYREHTLDHGAYYNGQESPENDAELNELNSDNGAFMPIKAERTTMDISQQKRIAGCMDKMCPMCGKVYSNALSFEVFQDHVESHFIDDTELDLSVEKNFEFVSNTVGQF